MPFDVLLHINEDSQRGRAIQRLADAQHTTPERAIEQIIDIGIQAQHFTLSPETSKGKTPAEMLIGLFSSPEDSAIMDEVTEIAYQGRNLDTTRDIGL